VLKRLQPFQINGSPPSSPPSEIALSPLQPEEAFHAAKIRNQAGQHRQQFADTFNCSKRRAFGAVFNAFDFIPSVKTPQAVDQFCRSQTPMRPFRRLWVVPVWLFLESKDTACSGDITTCFVSMTMTLFPGRRTGSVRCTSALFVDREVFSNVTVMVPLFPACRLCITSPSAPMVMVFLASVIVTRCPLRRSLSRTKLNNPVGPAREAETSRNEYVDIMAP
jgi:hypothetical protein